MALASALKDLIDVGRPCLHGVCPFCGGTIVFGFRPGGGNFAVFHSAYEDPTHPGEHTHACERFRDLSANHQTELLRLLRAAGFRGQPVT